MKHKRVWTDEERPEITMRPMIIAIARHKISEDADGFFMALGVDNKPGKVIEATSATLESRCILCDKLFIHYQSVPQLYCSRRCFHAEVKLAGNYPMFGPKWGSFNRGDPNLPPRINVHKNFPRGRHNKKTFSRHLEDKLIPTQSECAV